MRSSHQWFCLEFTLLKRNPVRDSHLIHGISWNMSFEKILDKKLISCIYLKIFFQLINQLKIQEGSVIIFL